MIKTLDYEKLKQSLQQFQVRKIEGRVLVAVSGGVDSMVMLDQLLKIQKKYKKIQLACAYVHHGQTGNRITDSYRKKSFEFVQKTCESLGLEFHTNKVKKVSRDQSEDQLRSIRLKFLEGVSGFDYIATAHHQDDVAETLLLRLIRGTGSQGLQVLDFQEGRWVRPIIFWTKEDVLKYAHKARLSWVEDPSNKSDKYLRNWVRNTWLKDLETRQKGGAQNLKNSLLRVREELASSQMALDDLSRHIEGDRIQKTSFLYLNRSEKKTVLAQYLRSRGIRGYGGTHIDEILKRLDSPRKNITFELLKCIWTIDTEHILAQKKSGLSKT